jgi:hypothetical protein
MKQKKTKTIFYFFLLIILSFSAHARVTDSSPGFFIGPDCPLEEFGESSASPDRVGLLPILVEAGSRCPRNPTRPPRTLEERCSDTRSECINSCLNRIGRNESNAKLRKSEKNCYAVCGANYRSCMGW